VKVIGDEAKGIGDEAKGIGDEASTSDGCLGVVSRCTIRRRRGS
jgi:hypothetical protein